MKIPPIYYLTAFRRAASICFLCVSASSVWADSTATIPRAELDACNVTWGSPSDGPRGSMPLGNGDIGLNVWVDPSGDLQFYISKTDAWDENMRLVKIGGVRMKFEPSLVKQGQPFTQTLDLATGKILITTPDQEISVWVDANHPAVQIDGKSLNGKPVSVTASPVLWRKGQKIDAGYNTFPKFPAIAHAETILPAANNQIGWYHANNSSPWLDNLKLQKLDEGENGKDPLRNRIFGAILRGDGFKTKSDTELVTESPVQSYSLRVDVRTDADAKPEAWLADIKSQAAKTEATSATDRKVAHEAWWDAFWNRSWIFLKGPASLIPVSPEPWRVGKASNGAAVFTGTISDARIDGAVLSPEEIAAMAKADRPGSSELQGKDIDFSSGLTMSAWINPGKNEKGRILDKIEARSWDGVLLDTHPGLSLRLRIGHHSLEVANCLTAGEWQHIAATADTKTGNIRLYRNGVLLQEITNESDAERVTKAYTLQRFINACGGRGAYPIKFNGSIFTADVGDNDADYRKWGGGYWFQNTRLMYWSMPMAGDLDLMLPLFKMYSDFLPMRRKATQKYFHHDGVYFPETTTIWGTFNDSDYGFNRNGKEDFATSIPHLMYYWQGGIELVTLMLDYYDYTGDNKFRDETLLPMAKEILTFYNQHWKRGDDGKIFFSPAQALECHFTATNPAPEVAGLRFIIPRLLPLANTPALKEEWSAMQKDLPEVATLTHDDGSKSLLPAATFSGKRQHEIPELYPVFPYSLYSVTDGKEAVEIGRNTFKTSSKKNNGWGQIPIMAAMLGLSEEAQDFVVGRVQKPAAGFRFPAFWGPNDDWMPDQNQMTIMLTTLQRMLMQSEGHKIYLLPAWPKNWEADFKLQAPGNTTVVGKVANGKMTELSVSPENRRKDIVEPAESK